MNPRSAHRRLQEQARRLIAEVYDAALQQAKDPGYRADPEADDVYARYNALDAFVAAHQQLRGHSLGWISAALQPGRGQRHGLAEETGEFALVDADEMELAVDRARYVQKAEDAHTEALAALEMRLYELNLALGTAADDQALHPQSLYRALEDALGELDADVKGKRIVYRLFHECLASRLGDFYGETNRLLIEAGLLPTEDDIRAAVRARQAAAAGLHAMAPAAAGVSGTPSPGGDWGQVVPSGPAGPDTGGPPGGVPSGAAAVGLTPQDAAVLQQYLGGGLVPTPGATAGPVPGAAGMGAARAAVTTSPLFGVLSTLQQAQLAAPAVSVGAPQELREHIIEALEGAPGGQGAQLSESEERTLDLVNGIFQEIHEHAELTDAVRAQLARLQIPVIKLALLEPRLFMDPAHPARRLINELVRVGVGIDGADDPLLHRLQALVERLLEGFDADAAPFEQALRALLEWEIREREQAGRAEDALRIQAEQEAIRRQAKQRVVGTIRHYIGNRTVPDEAMQFILKFWAPYMGLVLLREGRDSEAWREAVHVLRQIVEATQPNRSWWEVRAMVGDDAQLLEELEAQLEDTPLMKPERRRLLRLLREWFRTILDRRRPPAEETLLDESIPTLDEILPEDDPAEMAEEEPAPREIPAQVRPGAWFRLYMGKDHIPRRLKLLSVLESAGKVLFADRLAEDALEVDLDEFLEDLAAGRTRVIDEAGAFDRALSSVIRNIRDTLDARAG